MMKESLKERNIMAEGSNVEGSEGTSVRKTAGKAAARIGAAVAAAGAAAGVAEQVPAHADDTGRQTGVERQVDPNEIPKSPTAPIEVDATPTSSPEVTATPSPSPEPATETPTTTPYSEIDKQPAVVTAEPTSAQPPPATSNEVIAPNAGTGGAAEVPEGTSKGGSRLGLFAGLISVIGMSLNALRVRLRLSRKSVPEQVKKTK